MINYPNVKINKQIIESYHTTFAYYVNVVFKKSYAEELYKTI